VIRVLRDDERAWANELYRTIRFAETPPDTFAITYELAGDRIGLGRLVELEPGVIELGGIWTAEAARNRGIARAIVTALIEYAGSTPLWCIPFVHLQAFYESCGFIATPEPWPATVAAKMHDCVAKQLPPTVVLVRG
jgi:GNAT superfamily N-acetyltransferase